MDRKTYWSLLLITESSINFPCFINVLLNFTSQKIPKQIKKIAGVMYPDQENLRVLIMKIFRLKDTCYYDNIIIWKTFKLTEWQ